MGPNGSGKTTLAYALMGHPAYVVTGGEVIVEGPRHPQAVSPDKRARLGMFLAFQYPTAIPGLSVACSSGRALNAKLQGIDKNPDIDPTDPIKGGVSMRDFRNKMREKMALLQMDEGFATRYVNEGFSGGEKKRLEMLQMAVLEPEMAILDETDSGLDIDALRIVAEGVNAMLNPNLGVLLITHYQRLLNYITPDVVHVLAQGRIVKSGGKDLALRLEDEGYGPILREAGLAPDVPDEALLVPKGPTSSSTPSASRWRPPASAGRPAMADRGDATARRSTRVALRARLPDPRARRSTATRSSTSTRRRAARSRRSSSTRSTDYYREYNANVHRGIYTIGEKATAEYERARAQVARFINAPDSHEIVFTRNATEAINLVAYSWGRQEHRPRRRDRPDRDGAPREPRAVAAPRPGAGRRPRVHPDHRRRHPPPRRLRGAAPAQAEARRVHPRLEHARHHQPGPRDGRDGPRGRRARARRRRPGRAARAGRRPGARRRLLRVQRPQDARARWARARCGPDASCSRRCRRSSPAAR